MNTITDAQWNSYEENGYLKLGKLLSDNELAALQQRIDEIMLGTAKLDYSRVMMQLDTDSGKYEDMPEQTTGHKGATLGYRKMNNLEHDPLFMAYLQRPIFREISAHVLGETTPVTCFRAMFMNKPAHKGTFLPWHQDRWTSLDRDPLITLWTALDPATKENGCVQMIPGSHKLGVINPAHDSGFLTKQQAAEICQPERVVHLEVEAGEAVLMHNWLLHASDVNRTDIPRRAFSVCYMDARTQSKDGWKFSRIFGEGALEVGKLVVSG